MGAMRALLFHHLVLSIDFEAHKTKTTLGFCGDKRNTDKEGKRGWMEEGFELRIRAGVNTKVRLSNFIQLI